MVATDEVVDPAVRRPLGRTGIRVSALCAGTAGWSSVAGFRPRAPSMDETRAAARRLLSGPIRFADTSNNYGGGESEKRWGRIIREHGGLPDDFVLQTKLDRDALSDDFSGARVRRSLEESMVRLGVHTLPIVYLHDPEHTTWDEAVSPGGPVEEMRAMRAEGLVGALGVAGGPIDLLMRYVDLGIFDAVITHNRYTLVDRSAEPLLRHAHAAGVSVLNGAPYGGGILAAHPRTTDVYRYERAAPELLEAVDDMGRALSRRGIPLGAAALQFSLREPLITSTIFGAPFADHIDAALDLARFPIPADAWTEMDDIARTHGLL